MNRRSLLSSVILASTLSMLNLGVDKKEDNDESDLEMISPGVNIIKPIPSTQVIAHDITIIRFQDYVVKHNERFYSIEEITKSQLYGSVDLLDINTVEDQEMFYLHRINKVRHKEVHQFLGGPDKKILVATSNDWHDTCVEGKDDDCVYNDYYLIPKGVSHSELDKLLAYHRHEGLALKKILERLKRESSLA